jgi:hypothetical protein
MRLSELKSIRSGITQHIQKGILPQSFHGFGESPFLFVIPIIRYPDRRRIPHLLQERVDFDWRLFQ